MIVIVAASLLGALIFRDLLLERIYIATPSMEPTLAVRSAWWVDKLTLRRRRPQRGEIVVLASPVTAEKDLVKRVIAIAADTVEIRDKIVYVNGREIPEPYVQHTRANEMLVGDNLGPLKVPPDHLFVLGDNRDESGDSRDWKNLSTGEHVYFVHRDLIKGKLIGVPK